MDTSSLPALLFLSALLVAGTAACGGNGSGNSGNASADTLDVTMREQTLFMPRAVRAGPTVFQMRNAGTTPCRLHLAGGGRTDSLDAPLAPGATQAMTLDLAPGTYEVYCSSAEGRRLDGLDEQLIVSEGWGQTALPPNSDLRQSRQR